MKKSTLFLLLSTCWIVVVLFVHFKIASIENPVAIAVILLIGAPLFVAHAHYRDKDQ